MIAPLATDYIIFTIWLRVIVIEQVRHSSSSQNTLMNSSKFRLPNLIATDYMEIKDLVGNIQEPR